MTRTLLQEILECNRRYLNKQPGSLDPTGDSFLVVACIDSRLTGMLDACLGLPRNRAMVIRNAGNLISPVHQDVIRSVASALFVKNGKEILIVGHTDCALSKFSASDAIEAFRAQGIPRSAFGSEDLRAWFGAFSDVRDNIRHSIESLRNCGLVPPSIKVHGLLLDTASGALEILINGDETTASPVRSAEPVPAQSEITPASVPDTVAQLAKSSPAEPLAAGKKGPVKIGEVKSEPESQKTSANADAILELVLKLREIVLQERSNPRFKKEIADLSALLRNERNPAKILTALDRLTREYGSKYPTLPALLARAAAMIENRGGSSARFVELIRRIFE